MNHRSYEATSIGSGVNSFISSNRQASVLGRFRDGFYIGHGTDVVAIVGPTISPGPLNLRLRTKPTSPSQGAQVILGSDSDSDSDSGLEIGDLRIEMADAEPFLPTVPPEVGRSTSLAQLRVPVPTDLQSVWPTVRRAVEGRELAVARDHLCGRGQGLTPEGDDVLAAILLVAVGEPSLRPNLPGLIATAKTTNLSLAFLAWAAQGECVAEVHDLLWAAANDDQDGFEAARRHVDKLGGSTGPAMLAGFSLASSMCRASTSPSVLADFDVARDIG